jgi:hypothetical protein
MLSQPQSSRDAGASVLLLRFLRLDFPHRHTLRTEDTTVQIVMDPTGDTRHEFNTADASALAEAERRFKQLTGAGFTAAARTADGRSELIRHFDPTAEETIFFPRLQGG